MGTVIMGSSMCYTGFIYSGNVGDYALYYPMRNGYTGYATQNNTDGFGVTFNSSTGLAVINVPDGYGTDGTGNWSLSYIFKSSPPNNFRECGGNNLHIYPCSCTPKVNTAFTNKTASGYKGVLSLEAGECGGSLSNIEWSPAPTSGQGTATAVYENCDYNTTYQAVVTSTDSNGCLAMLNFSFSQMPGSYPPSCQW